MPRDRAVWHVQIVGMKLEAGTGIEPTFKDLQSSAWPLCHRARRVSKRETVVEFRFPAANGRDLRRSTPAGQARAAFPPGPGWGPSEAAIVFRGLFRI